MFQCFSGPYMLLGAFSQERKEGQNGHVDLRARTSPQVKIEKLFVRNEMPGGMGTRSKPV